jgi:hypothetical protein
MVKPNICSKCGKYRKNIIDSLCHSCFFGCKPDEVKCIVCGKIKHHRAKGMCGNCYIYKGTPKIKCKMCGQLKNHWAKGYCANCHNKKFDYDRIIANNVMKYHNIGLELYREITKSCILCDFNKIVELHHLDGNHRNSTPENLIGLCPNHHKLLHTDKYGKEIRELILKKMSKE